MEEQRPFKQKRFHLRETLGEALNARNEYRNPCQTFLSLQIAVAAEGIPAAASFEQSIAPRRNGKACLRHRA